MKRFDLTVFRRFWAIAKLYWLGPEKWRALGLLAIILGLLATYTRLSVEINEQQGEIISALSQADSERFWRNVWLFLGVLGLYVPIFSGYRYLSNRLGLAWRRWETERYLNRYMDNRSFYDALDHPEIDNPDQRIAEDIKAFTAEALKFVLIFLQSILETIAFSIALWDISKPLVFFLAAYTLFGNLITVGVYGRPLVRLNFQQLKKEANFRFGLVRVRENAEPIAFYQGEDREQQGLNGLFDELFENFKRLILWRDLNFQLFSRTYEFLPYVIPAVVIGPKILGGDLDVGDLSKASGAFLRIFFSLNEIVSRFEDLTKFTAGVDRLSAFEDYLQATRADRRTIAPTVTQTPTIDVAIADHLTIEHLTLNTPDYQRVLFADLSCQLASGEGLLVIGPSGCGKSSILRAIAGLWNAGTGKITRPALDEMLFLPQKPYMILGTLREQLLYPGMVESVSDEQLQGALVQVNLPDLRDRFGGFDVMENWSERLSLGEQQRIAFARVLLNQPSHTILDEATSALDIKNEATLYEHLQHTNTTFISVGHRPTLRQYHQWVLELQPDQSWTLDRV